MLVVIGVIVALNPGIKFTPLRFMLNKLIDYRRAKRNAELLSQFESK